MGVLRGQESEKEHRGEPGQRGHAAGPGPQSPPLSIQQTQKVQQQSTVPLKTFIPIVAGQSKCIPIPVVLG